MSSYIVPGMSEKLGKRIFSRKDLKLIKEQNRLIVTTQNISGGCSSATVVPFKSKKEEELFVLEKEKRNAEITDSSFLSIFLQFATRTITYCMYRRKKIQIEDRTVYEAPYIFDGQSKSGNEITIVPAGELFKLNDLFRWDKAFVKNVKENPKKMCLLYYYKRNTLWLDKGYTKVSELKKLYEKQLV
jgi:hypothetical protein